MTDPKHPVSQELAERSPAQFFFEVGFGACWAEAFIRNGETPPFPLTDDVLDKAWMIAPEAHDDPAEFDAYLALASTRPIPTAPQSRDGLVERLRNGGIYGVHNGCAATIANLIEHDSALRTSGEATEPSAPLSDEAVERALRKAFCDGVAWEKYGVNPFEKAVAESIAALSASISVTAPKYVLGPVWKDRDNSDEDGSPVWTAEIQTIGGHSVIATVHGCSEAEAQSRQITVLAALSTPDTVSLKGDRV